MHLGNVKTLKDEILMATIKKIFSKRIDIWARRKRVHHYDTRLSGEKCEKHIKLPPLLWRFYKKVCLFVWFFVKCNNKFRKTDVLSQESCEISASEICNFQEFTLIYYSCSLLSYLTMFTEVLRCQLKSNPR